MGNITVVKCEPCYLLKYVVNRVFQDPTHSNWRKELIGHEPANVSNKCSCPLETSNHASNFLDQPVYIPPPPPTLSNQNNPIEEEKKSSKKCKTLLKLLPLITMAMKNSRKESIRSIIKLKLFIRKLQKVLLVLASTSPRLVDPMVDEEEMEVARMVPKDVKEGHFVVTAVKGTGEQKRFAVELRYLHNPAFLKLLELAKEEYGFDQQGVLALPCQPEELEMILRERRGRR